MKKEFKGNREAGKGSKRRKEDFRRVRTHWENIKGFRPSKFPEKQKSETEL